MYIPEHFKIEDKVEIFTFIKANTFCQLISSVEGRLYSTHLPFYLLENKMQIVAHMARQNPQHIELEQQEVLITIQGSHEYISPSWYGSFGVPTWNYQAVHLYGHCELSHNLGELKEIVDTLSNFNEAKFEQPWQPDFPSAKLNGIVGIRFNIEEMQCKYKINQNRPLEDRKRVIEKLKEMGSNELAKAMENNVI